MIQFMYILCCIGAILVYCIIALMLTLVIMIARGQDIEVSSNEDALTYCCFAQFLIAAFVLIIYFSTLMFGATT